MKAFRGILFIMLALSLLVYGQTARFDKIRYISGKAQTVTKADDWANRLTITSDTIKLELKDGQDIMIDPKRVTNLSYGQEAHRRGNSKPLDYISPVSLYGRIRKTPLHFISMDYSGPGGSKTALLIQAHKDNYRAVLIALHKATNAPVSCYEEDRQYLPVGIESVAVATPDPERKEGEAKEAREGREVREARKSEGGSSAPSAPKGATGAIKITSAPEGAEIYIDDSFVGNTPAQLKLAPGKRHISVGMEGYKKWERDITVTSGSELTLNATMQK